MHDNVYVIVNDKENPNYNAEMSIPAPVDRATCLYRINRFQCSLRCNALQQSVTVHGLGQGVKDLIRMV